MELKDGNASGYRSNQQGAKERLGGREGERHTDRQSDQEIPGFPVKMSVE